VASKPARDAEKRGHELEPKRGDTEAVLNSRRRMANEEGKEINKQRAATSDLVRNEERAAPKKSKR
jgi:hypothetical protein